MSDYRATSTRQMVYRLMQTRATPGGIAYVHQTIENDLLHRQFYWRNLAAQIKGSYGESLLAMADELQADIDLLCRLYPKEDADVQPANL